MSSARCRAWHKNCLRPGGILEFVQLHATMHWAHLKMWRHGLKRKHLLSRCMYALALPINQFRKFLTTKILFFFSAVCKWNGTEMKIMAAYAWAEHIAEVVMYIGAVLAQLQTVDPCRYPTNLEIVVKCLVALRYMKHFASRGTSRDPNSPGPCIKSAEGS